MRIIVGVSPDDAGADAVALGAVLARLTNGHVILAHVQPPTIDYPSMGNVDAEWEAFLGDRTRETLARASARLQNEWGIHDFDEVVGANSAVSRGLAAIAEAQQADVIVLGPGSQGPEGHVSLGSIAHSLLRGGACAVALAPEGYRDSAPDDITRFVIGFQDADSAAPIVEVARDLGGSRDIPLHLLTIILRVTRIVGARIGSDPERMVMDSLVHQAMAAQQEFIEDQGGLTGSVVQGDTAERAMSRFDWQEGDLFILASSRFAVLKHVFLGDVSYKLLRGCEVPALVVPRGIKW